MALISSSRLKATTGDEESGPRPRVMITSPDGSDANAQAPQSVQGAEAGQPTNTQPEGNKSWMRRVMFDDTPTFKSFIASEWKDILLLALVALPPLFIYIWAKPLIPKFFRLQEPQYDYPMLKEFIPTWMSTIVTFLLPVITILPVSLFLIGSFWDCHAAIMGYSYALVAATMFQSLVKWVIGGMRPNFQEACKPNTIFSGEGPGRSYYTPVICRGKESEVNNALMSFPSGHAAAAAASFVFLALWINAKFKIFADYHSRFWQLLLFALPITIGTLIGASKTMDYWHHWYDVLAGGIIGLLFALLAYRQKYHAVFDYRYNHIPLPFAHDAAYKDKERKPLPRRDLTAINFAGWENKRTKRDTGH